MINYSTISITVLKIHIVLKNRFDLFIIQIFVFFNDIIYGDGKMISLNNCL